MSHETNQATQIDIIDESEAKVLIPVERSIGGAALASAIEATPVVAVEGPNGELELISVTSGESIFESTDQSVDESQQ